MIQGKGLVGLFLVAGLTVLQMQGCGKKKEPAEPKIGADARESTEVYVTTQDVKVRSGPGTRYKIVADIKSGTRVNVEAHESGWLRVISRRGRPPGYIDERFAKPASPAPAAAAAPKAQGAYTATADLTVRQGPGLHYKSVARIEKGTKVNVVGAEGDWLKVQSKYGRPPGYIERAYAERRRD